VVVVPRRPASRRRWRSKAWTWSQWARSLQTFDEEGYAEEGLLYLQLKATDSMAPFERPRGFAFPVDMRHYHLWRRERMPVVLILYDAANRRAYWLHTQAYFDAHPVPKRGRRFLTVHFPRKNVFGARTISMLRQCKAKVLEQMPGGAGHHG